MVIFSCTASFFIGRGSTGYEKLFQGFTPWTKKVRKHSVLGKAVTKNMGWGVVGIATCYELDGLGIETQLRQDFPHLSRLAQ
jgi:hypothetical protein